jgi:hypothetical protein
LGREEVDVCGSGSLKKPAFYDLVQEFAFFFNHQNRKKLLG